MKERKKGQTNIEETQDKQHLSSGQLDMKKPKQDNLQWRSKHFKRISLEDSSLASEAISCINKFSNDVSFMNSIINQQNKDSNFHDHSLPETKVAKNINGKDFSESRDFGEVLSTKIQAVSSYQLTAKVLQLRMKGKHEEAENLSKHMDLLVENSNARSKVIRQEVGGNSSRFIEKKLSSERKKHENNSGKLLAQKILQNRRYSMSGNADDEYDFYEGAPKYSKKKDVTHEDKINLPKRMLTQKERCQFCFEKQSRPNHLAILIGNVTHMMLPPWEPVLQGHCCILQIQHESATKTFDKNVWEEIQNFVNCLLKIFSSKDMDVIFLETIIGLSMHRRHCLIECIPIPSHIAKQAPLYFKKGKKVNPKELNLYLQDNGSGYPYDELNSAGGSNQLLSFSLVGDGGASWRLKALKRSKEQAAREGLTLQEVVRERWGSFQELATSVAVHRSAPAHAHLHAIKERKKEQTNIEETQDKLFNNKDYLQHLSYGELDMKKPKQDNLQWRSKHFKRISLEDSSLASEAISCINKFSNNGGFINSINNQQNKNSNVHDHSFPETKEAKYINEKDLIFVLEVALRSSKKAVPNKALASESRDFGEGISTKIQAGKKVNPKELILYLQDNGSGYPNGELNSRGGSNQLHSSSLVGDGGASW